MDYDWVVLSNSSLLPSHSPLCCMEYRLHRSIEMVFIFFLAEGGEGDMTSPVTLPPFFATLLVATGTSQRSSVRG